MVIYIMLLVVPSHSKNFITFNYLSRLVVSLRVFSLVVPRVAEPSPSSVSRCWSCRAARAAGRCTGASPRSPVPGTSSCALLARGPARGSDRRRWWWLWHCPWCCSEWAGPSSTRSRADRGLDRPSRSRHLNIKQPINNEWITFWLQRCCWTPWKQLLQALLMNTNCVY